jgi:hypothetical protein
MQIPIRFDAARIKQKLRECSSTNRRRRRIGMSRLFVKSAQRTRSAVDRLCFSFLCVPMHTNHTHSQCSQSVGGKGSERAKKQVRSPQLERTPASSSVYAHRSTHCLVYSDQAICKPNVCHAIYSSEKLHDA